jgi:lipoate-protein ligase A
MNSMQIPSRDLEVTCWSAPTVAQNLMIDDQLSRTVGEMGRSVLRFWWGGPPAVVMGFSEKTDQVVNQAECRRLGIEVLKRFTGGGTVLQTAGVFNYSLVIPSGGLVDPKRVFEISTNLICAILKTFDLSGSPEGTSDVAVGGRKISGNAQAQRRRGIIVHGTLLVDFDYNLAETVLLHPSREPGYRQHRSHRDFMITLSQLRERMDRQTIEQKAIEAAQETVGTVGHRWFKFRG